MRLNRVKRGGDGESVILLWIEVFRVRLFLVLVD